MNMSLLQHISSEESFLIWINGVLYTMTVDNVFCKYTDNSFCWSIAFMEGKSLSRGRMYSNKNKMLPLPWWKQPNVVNLKKGSSFNSLGKVAVSGNECCNPLLKNLTLVLGEWTSVLLIPVIFSNPATMATIYMSPLLMTGMAGKRDWYSQNMSSYLFDY